jgi:hypothetical protein
LIANAEIAQTNTITTIPRIQRSTFTNVGIQDELALTFSFSTTISVGVILISGLSLVYSLHILNKMSYSVAIVQILRLTMFS